MSNRRSSVRSSASVSASPAAFTIEEYKRKQKVLAASKKPRRRSSVYSKAALSATAISSACSSRSSGGPVAGTASSLAASSRKHTEPTYSKTQKQYLDFCVEKLVDPDMKLLSAIREGGFLLKLDSFGVEEVCELGGVQNEALAPTRDRGHPDPVGSGAHAHQAIAMALGKCANLQQLSLAGCQLTDKARDHISKIITLHGVLKDETVWSSSLRGETVGVAAARPSFLLDLSQNALGDEAVESICNVLFHDKWLLGLNLSQNRISRAGISQVADTLAQSNRTLAVIQVSNMKEPVDQVNLRRLEALMLKRKPFLQNLAFETREKRLLLCSVLLEWGVNRELVLEICQSSELAHRGGSKSRSSGSSVSGSSVSSSLFRPWRDEHEAKSNQIGMPKSGARSTTVSNQEEEEKDDFESDNQSEGSSNFGLEYQQQQQQRHRHYQPSNVGKANSIRSPQRVSKQQEDHHQHHRSVSASETHMAHIQTIKLLTERMSAMEVEQRRARSYMHKLEEENQQLRDQLRTTMGGGAGMSHVEERIIARLEDTISTLAQQVGELTLEKSSIATTDDKAAEKENVPDSVQEQ